MNKSKQQLFVLAGVLATLAVIPDAAAGWNLRRAWNRATGGKADKPGKAIVQSVENVGKTIKKAAEDVADEGQRAGKKIEKSAGPLAPLLNPALVGEMAARQVWELFVPDSGPLDNSPVTNPQAGALAKEDSVPVVTDGGPVPIHPEFFGKIWTLSLVAGKSKNSSGESVPVAEIDLSPPNKEFKTLLAAFGALDEGSSYAKLEYAGFSSFTARESGKAVGGFRGRYKQYVDPGRAKVAEVTFETAITLTASIENGALVIRPGADVRKTADSGIGDFADAISGGHWVNINAKLQEKVDASRKRLGPQIINFPWKPVSARFISRKDKPLILRVEGLPDPLAKN